MKAVGMRAQRRLIVGGMVATCVALAVASVSWACTTPTGFTWYSDGTFSKSGPSGTQVTAYGTGARATTAFLLVTGNNEGTPGHEGHACMFNTSTINPNIRMSNAAGAIPNTSGFINAAAGTWQVCFREPGGASATIPVQFTVL